MSKGSKRRPTDEAKFQANYDAVFSKPKPADLSQESLEKVCDEIKSQILDQGEVITLKPTKAWFHGDVFTDELVRQLNDAEILRDHSYDLISLSDSTPMTKYGKLCYRRGVEDAVVRARMWLRDASGVSLIDDLKELLK